MYSTVYTTGKEAYLIEQSLLKEFKDFSYKGNKFLTKGGESEVLNSDSENKLKEKGFL